MKNRRSICSDELYIRSISYVANSTRYMPVEEITWNVHRTCDLFVYIIDGYAEYTFDGVKYSARAGDVVYLANGCNYDRHIKSDLYHFICVEFTFDTPPNTMEPKVFSNAQELDSLFKKIYKLWYLKDTSYKSKCMSVLYEIYSGLIGKEFSTYIPERRKDVFKDIIKRMSEEYGSKEIYIQGLAQMANMSEVHFRKIFKNIYKISPQQYIIGLRIERAKELLAFGDFSISQISDMLGFSDTCHFSRTFKQKVGYSPTEYRNTFNKF